MAEETGSSSIEAVPGGASAAAAAVAVAEPARPWGPTQPEERISTIDVLRGLALFGIIAANMRGFAGPMYAYFHTSALWNTRTDLWVQAFVDTFIQGKFITLFAFLFGVGFSLQFSRAEVRGGKFVVTYARRSSTLILFGVLHQLLFWTGDILITYGLGGFLLILFRKRKNKTILIWALGLMLLPLVGGTGYAVFRHFRPESPQKLETAKKKAEARRQKNEVEMRKAITVYQTRSYVAIFKYRFGEAKSQFPNQGGAVFLTLPIFLLGLLVFRRGIFQDPEAHRAALKKGLIIGLAAGVPANIAFTWISHVLSGQTQVGAPSPLMGVNVFLMFFGRPVLSMGYACAVGLLFLDPAWRQRMMPFAVIGRTALTNYLFQTVFCTTIFYGYGGGLYGKVHLIWLLPLSVAVYALEVPLSRWWLARYRFGPMEWLWRTMTYGKAPVMRRVLSSEF